MSRSVYLIGFDAGSEAAGLCPVAIQCTQSSQERGALAGLKLDSLARRQESGNSVVSRTDSWRHGFFDGFMSRAEEISDGCV